jgi:hypothetical protein
MLDLARLWSGDHVIRYAGGQQVNGIGDVVAMLAKDAADGEGHVLVEEGKHVAALWSVRPALLLEGDGGFDILRREPGVFPDDLLGAVASLVEMPDCRRGYTGTGQDWGVRHDTATTHDLPDFLGLSALGRLDPLDPKEIDARHAP